MTRTFHKDGSKPNDEQIFVFGSNLSGIHGAGAAKAARLYYGAVWGVAEGRTGRSYAIPTVAENISGPLDIETIRQSVNVFLHHAATHPEDSFFVTRIGCGLAGHKDVDIAPMFRDASLNCSLPYTWWFIDVPPCAVCGEADCDPFLAHNGVFDQDTGKIR